MRDALFVSLGFLGLALLLHLGWRLYQFSSYLRFVRLVRAGRLDDALSLFPRLLRLVPRLVEGGPMLTQASLDVRLLGLPLPEERVREFFEQVASLGRARRPSSPSFLRLEANLLRQRGRLEEGLPLVEEAVRVAPEDPVNHQQRAWFHELSGDLEQASREYRAALDLVAAGKGETWGRRAGALRASLHRSLSQALSRQGRLDEAADSLREAVRLDPCSPEGLFTQVALAGVQERAGRSEQAISDLRKGLAECSEGGALLNQTLASLLTRAGRYDEAEEVLSAAEALEPGSVSHPLARAEIEAGRGRMEAALAHLDRAVAAEPHNPAVQLALARHFERQGDDARAMVHLERAVESASGEVGLAPMRDATWQPPRERLADCYARVGRTEDAEREYRRALKEGSSSASLRASLGTLLKNLGREEEGEALTVQALTILEEGLQRAPGDPRLLQALGALCLQGGRVEEAREYLQRATQLGPGDYFLWRDLGQAERALGRPEEAGRHWRRALEFSKRPDLTRQVEGLLEGLESAGQTGETPQIPTETSGE